LTKSTPKQAVLLEAGVPPLKERWSVAEVQTYEKWREKEE